MTLTNKRWLLLLIIPLLLLAFALLPQTAQAQPGGPPRIDNIYATSPTSAIIFYTPDLGDPPGTTTYAPNIGTVSASTANSITVTGLAAGSNTFTVTATEGGTTSLASNAVTINTNTPPFTVSLTGPVTSITINAVQNLDALGGPVLSTTAPFQVYYNGSLRFNAAVNPGVFNSGLVLTRTSGSGTFSWNNGIFSLSNITSSNSINITGITQWGNNNYWWGSGYYGYGYDYVYHATASASTYTGRETISYTINAPLYNLSRVGVDRMQLVSGTHYTVSSVNGNKTQIIFTQSFLNSLSRGTHDFTFSFTDGSATARLTVQSGNSSGNNYYGSGNATATQKLTVYNKASTKGKKLGSIARGESMAVTGFTTSGSYAIINFGGQEGYVNANYINASLAEAMTGRMSATTYLYTAKSTNSKYRFIKVYKNTAVTLLAREGSYWKVNYDGDVLYARASNVKNITVG